MFKTRGKDSSRGSRTRWAAIGAAVAVTLGAGGLSLAGATISEGDRPVFVAISACRLTDTRPTSTVGPRSTPIGTTETYLVQGTGTNGNCTITTDATSLVLNVTAVNPTRNGYLTVWPTGVARPTASSLNWLANDPPTPNAVTVDLSDFGQFNVFNNDGTVDVIIDVVGYYEDHDHDERYYTQDEVDDLLAAQPMALARQRVVATPGASATAAREAAPEVDLFTAGSITIYGKCFTDTTGPTTHYEIFVKTSEDGAVLDSRNDSLHGGATTDFLNIDTDETDATLEDDSTGEDTSSGDSEDDSDFVVFAPDGTTIRGHVAGFVKNGTLPGGNGVFGSGDVCLFTGGIFSIPPAPVEP